MQVVNKLQSDHFFIYALMKAIVYLLIFALLHFLYDWLPYFPFNLISGTSESVFQHMKIAFYAYLVLIAVEYLIVRKSVTTKQDYIIARLQSAIIVPFLIILLWYIVPAIYNKEITSLALELIHAFVVSYIIAFIGAYFDREYEQHKYTKATKIIIVLLIVVAIFIYTMFTYKLPWIDLWQEP